MKGRTYVSFFLGAEVLFRHCLSLRYAVLVCLGALEYLEASMISESKVS